MLPTAIHAARPPRPAPTGFIVRGNANRVEAGAQRAVRRGRDSVACPPQMHKATCSPRTRKRQTAEFPGSRSPGSCNTGVQGG